jgi:hypothetical protein
MSEKDDDDVVSTPMGPLPRRNVHHVRPGEKVRINECGEPEIVPDESIAGDEEREKEKP